MSYNEVEKSSKLFTMSGERIVKYIGEGGNLVVPDGITEIMQSAFEGCATLKKVVIPDSVTKIYESAFRNCTALEEVMIGNGITSIGNHAFSGCPINMATIPSFAASYINNKNLETVIITCGTSIDDGAFSGCTRLTSITIPNSVMNIGKWAFAVHMGRETSAGKFYECSNIENIYYSGNIASWCGISGLANLMLYGKASKNLYLSGTLVTGNFVIPSSVKKIGDYAFFNCAGLTSVTILNSVTSIGIGAFRGCTGLTGIKISSSVTNIGSLAFSGCTGLASITIPDSVINIDNGAFERCTGLTDITIPNSVTSIGENVFSGCTGLISIRVESNNALYHSVDNCIIETKSKTLILGCKNSVIPSDGSITSIGNHAFSGCKGLKNITIPESVISIDAGAFSGCIGLTNITIPKSVTSIGIWAFSGCIGLTSITIQPESVVSIDSDAFWGCTGLTNITIPKSVTSIGSMAFFGCKGLASIAFNGTIEQWEAIAKCDGWSYDTGKYTIHCTNGDIVKS